MKTAASLSVPSVRQLVDDLQKELWWDYREKKWDRDKDWGVPCGPFTLLRIAEFMACSDLRPEEGHVELS